MHWRPGCHSDSQPATKNRTQNCLSRLSTEALRAQAFEIRYVSIQKKSTDENRSNDKGVILKNIAIRRKICQNRIAIAISVRSNKERLYASKILNHQLPRSVS